MFLRFGRKRGMSLVELMIAVLIGFVALSGVAYLIIFVARSQAVLIPQLSNQLASGRAQQSMNDLLRNTSLESVVIQNGGSRIDFLQPARFSSGAPLSSLRFQDIDSDPNNTEMALVYYHDVDDESESRIIARGLESVSFQLIDGRMIEISVEFLYRKFRGYNSGDTERMNGTFTTQIFPRNV